VSFPIYQPKSLKDQEYESTIKKLKPDFIIVAAYGQILPQNILDISPCINLHASLLPLYRGASPIQESILNDDNYTGVTAMMMEKGLDSGDILALKYLKINDNDNVVDLFEKLSNEASSLTLDVLENYDKINPKKQNLSKVSHCGKISKDDGIIKFTDAKKIYQKYKAYNFWPQIFLESSLKIKDCNLNETNSNNNQGEILDIKKSSIIVGCNKGSLEILTVQPSSKKAMSVVDYIRGQRLEIGNIFI
jgi:methionyl-tRNA formyltransferase